MKKVRMKIGKLMLLFCLAFLLLPIFIGVAPFALLWFFQTIADWGVFGTFILLSPVWIIGFFLIKFIVKKVKSQYDNLTGKQDWRNNLTEQDIRARKRAEEYFRG